MQSPVLATLCVLCELECSVCSKLDSFGKYACISYETEFNENVHFYLVKIQTDPIISFSCYMKVVTIG